MKKILCLCLTLLLLTGCGQVSYDDYTPTGDGLTYDEDYTGPAATRPADEGEQVLMLAYYPEETMNPYLSTDFTNRALFSLLYQGLFAVDRDYNVYPMLCSRYSVSENMRTWVFYVDENATFSDGTHVTSEDVLASLQAACADGYYRSRFTNVQELKLNWDGGVSVTMKTAYENLPILLDVPIVKAAQVAESHPIGSGPYTLRRTGTLADLVKRNNWWCQSDSIITADTISLLAAQSINHIRDEFQFGSLSLVQADTGSDRYADYLCDYELWDSENGIFLYIGFNMESSTFKDAKARKAITYAIDRDAIASKHYRGFARGASLPASPISPYYNANLASHYDYDPEAFLTAAAEAGLVGKTVTMLVNDSDSRRLQVAESIVEMFADAGITVKIVTPNGATFNAALVARGYDMYLAQTALSPNMDLSHFFAPNGNLNYGAMSSMEVYTLAQQALENHGNFYTLHQAVMEQGLLCPILFRGYAVYANRGLLTQLTPSRDNVFYYSIGKTMESAKIQPTTAPTDPTEG